MRLFQPKCHCTAKLRQIRKSLNHQRNKLLSPGVELLPADVFRSMDATHDKMVEMAEKMECEICCKDKIKIPVDLASSFFGFMDNKA